MEEENNKNISQVLNDLMYRIEITKRARIKASSRLRLKHERFERVIQLYSILVLILTVWFLGKEEDTYFITKFLLVLSLTVTFLSMYLNMKNYKERAGNFETNYQNLDILLNKIERKQIEISDLDIYDIKEYQREYEKLIIDKENHISEDYQKALNDFNRSLKRKKGNQDKNKESEKKEKENRKSIKGISKNECIELLKYYVLLTFPIWIATLLYILEKVI